MPDGVELQSLGGNCPVQGLGTVDGLPFYFRARGEHWSFEVTHEGGDPPFTDAIWRTEREYDGGEFAAGWMDRAEAVGFIAEAVALFRLEYGNAAGVCAHG